MLSSASAVAVAWMLVTYARFVPTTSLDGAFVAAAVAPLMLAAAVLSLRRPRIGYPMIVIGAALPLFWIYRTESRAFVNSWVLLNASGDREETVYLGYAQLRIVCAALLLFVLVWALIRLLPPSWQLRNLPVNRRTWPAVVIASFVVAWWFTASAFPYRQPVILDAQLSELDILHVEKNGLGFHETSIRIYRDGQFFMAHNDRRLFRYKFEEVWHGGALTEGQRMQLKTVLELPDLKRTEERAPRALRVAHGDGWYTETGRSAIAAFTTENATVPPAELVAFFRGIAEMPLDGPSHRYDVRDVCLGFCYDPQAGLGYRAMNQRCRDGADNKEYCY